MATLRCLVGCLLMTLHCIGAKYTTIECPYPEGTSVSTESRCNAFSACEWTDTTCHMRDGPEASYVANGSYFNVHPGTQQFYWTKPKPVRTMFNNVIMDLAMRVIAHEDYHFQIKIVDRNAARYEVPIPLNLPTTAGQNPLYEVVVCDSEFGFQVYRKETKEMILSTVGPLIYEDQFLQINFKLSSTFLYGLGENTHLTLRHRFEPRTTFPMWSRGQYYTEEPKSLMGLHPLFTVFDDATPGHAHSVFVLNSNAMESSTFLLDDGSPALTLRSIGGIVDLHVFMGPTPEELNTQYIKMIGLPSLPPYYYLGFHLSRYGYNGTDQVREVVHRNKEAGVPQDVQTIDINYMSHFRSFTIDDTPQWADLPTLAHELHEDDVRLTLILDHPIVIDWTRYPPGQRGKDSNAFIRWPSPYLVPSDQPLSCEDYVLGYMWPDNKTVFPDFLSPNGRQWWADEVVKFQQTVNFDDIWLDLNEPNNFGTDLARPENFPPGLPAWSLKCPDNRWEDPPYPTMTVRITDNESGRISDSTLCMTSVQKGDANETFLHYDVHALYGLKHSEATFRGLQAALPQKRSMVLGAATYPGYGQYGAHWLGDNHSTWNNMRLSIIGLIEMNMFGIPMVGADICGHIGEASAELCARWTQLGAFYSYSRNHNNEGNRAQDPASWGPPVTEICKNALLIRYTYLPYLYTLLYMASREGHSVIRPLWNVFPEDVTARDVEDQFLWGRGLMVAPVLHQGAIHRDVYFPQGRWFDLLTGEEIHRNGSKVMTVTAPLEVIPLYLHGGTILPAQEPDIRTGLSRLNAMKLIVVLDDTYSSSGLFFWDDGLSPVLKDTNSQLANVQFQEDTLQYEVTSGSVAEQGLTFDQVKLFGGNPETPPSGVFLNGDEMEASDWLYDVTVHTLVIKLNQPISEDFQIYLQRNESAGDICY